MTANPTPGHTTPADVVTAIFPELCKLSTIQAQALAMRLRGESITRIGKKLHVTRQTVSLWCNHHPAFVAELNRRQHELLAESAMVYRRLLRKSFNVIKEVLDEGQPESLRVALSMVNGPTSRAILSREPGPTDEIGVINQMALDEQKTWEPKEGYMEVDVHQDYAHRLAQVDFSPKPTPDSPQKAEMPEKQ